MGAKDTATTTIMTLIFGVLVGVIGVSFLAYYGGFISWDARGMARIKNVSATPGMDMLNAYQCRKAETKHIILGGIEDGFSSNGNEAVPVNEAAERISKRSGHRLAFRSYDELGNDKALLDEFLIPSKTAHGLVVLRIKPPTKLKNDHIGIGDLRTGHVTLDYAGTYIDSEVLTAPWATSDNVLLENDKLVWAKLEDLTFDLKRPNNYSNFLAYIRSNKNEASPSASTRTYVKVADDTAVDFIGFTICEEPLVNKGTVFTAGVIDIGGEKDITSLSCLGTDGVECDPYLGDMVCSEALPLACFRDGEKPNPYDDGQWNMNWSGGDTKLTPAIRGNQFTNADQVHEYCASLFGQDWRAASFHDGTANYIISYADIPNGTLAWVDVKGQKYANCWAPRADYEETQ